MLPKEWQRIGGFAILAIAVAGAGLAYARLAPAAVDVVAPVSNADIRVFGLGTVEARVLSRVGFEVGAAIVEVTADHGDHVARGAVLARLHDEEQKAKVARARAAVMSTQVVLKKAEANVLKAEAVLKQKSAANVRKQELKDRRVVADQSAEEALRDEDVAKADLAVAMAEVEVARSQIADAKALLSYESTILDHHSLRAPYDALIVQRHVEPGAVVKAGDLIFTLIDPTTVWAMAHVDESRAGAIQEGQAVEVRLRSLPQQVFKGRVARIGIESDRVTEERRVYVKCEQCPPRFFLGEQAEVLINVGRVANALMVPEGAVKTFDGATAVVWTVEDGRLAERRVTIGHRTDDARLQIIDGLPAEAQIAVGIPDNARIGRRVSPREVATQ